MRLSEFIEKLTAIRNRLQADGHDPNVWVNRSIVGADSRDFVLGDVYEVPMDDAAFDFLKKPSIIIQ